MTDRDALALKLEACWGTEEQIKIVEDYIAIARAEALEEAAKLCEHFSRKADIAQRPEQTQAMTAAASAIRALMEPPA